MDIEKSWQKALKETEIIRARVQALQTLSETAVPYVLLSESVINEGDTIVRKGQVIVTQPSLLIPPNNPQLQGFDLDADEGITENGLINFLLVRGVSLPSLRYDNQTQSLDVREGSLADAIKYYKDLFARQENVSAGLIVGPEDCWPFSLLIFICAQIARNSRQDIQKIIDDLRRHNNHEEN